MTIIRKIRFYSFNDLLCIFFWKSALAFVIWSERIFSFFFYRRSKGSSLYISIKKSNLQLPLLSNELLKNKIAATDKILAGFISLLGRNFAFDYNIDWLKDPVSGNFWDKSVYFNVAMTKRAGYGDVKYILELNKFNHLIDVAVSYGYTKRESCFKYVQESLAGWRKCVRFRRSVVHRILMDAAFRGINLIYIATSMYEDSERYKFLHNDILHILIEEERLLRKYHTLRWYKTGNAANHAVGELVGLIAIQRYLHYHLGYDYSRQIIKEYYMLEQLLKRLISPRGVYLECSANYSRVVAEFLIALDMIETSCGENLSSVCRIHLYKLLKYLEALSCRGMFPNFGDNDAASVLIAYKNGVDDNDFLLSYRSCKLSDLNYLDSQIRYDYNLDGQFIWRSLDKRDVFMFIRHGQFAYFRETAAVHSHCDLLSIIMSIRGMPLFIDRGTSFYNLSTQLRMADMGTASHNTICVDGVEQAEFCLPGYESYPFSKYTSCANGTKLFSAEIRYSGIVHCRSIFYESGCITIDDSVKSSLSDRVATCSFLLHPSVTPVARGDKSIALYRGHDYICSFVFYDSKYELVNAECYPHFGTAMSTFAIVSSFRLKDTYNSRIKLELV